MLACLQGTSQFRITFRTGNSPHMTIQSKTSRRFGYILVPAISAALLGSPQLTQAAPVDPAITAAVTAMNASDIENIVNIVVTTTSALGAGTIKLTGKNLSTFAKGAGAAIAAKTPAIGPNRPDNKGDEVGEVAAYGIAGLATNPKMAKKGFALGKLKAYLRFLMSTPRVTAELLTLSSNLFRDVGASAANTINSNGALAPNAAKIIKGLNKAANSIVGKPQRDLFRAGLALGTGSNALFENGNDPAGKVADPETDLHPG
jgi:hypothetical protein